MIDKYIKQWLNRADNDIKIVEHELSFPKTEILKDIVCFHCQQAVEKYLKSFLIYNKIEISKTHNIELLLMKCAEIDIEFNQIDIKELSNFAVDIRYPDDFYVPELEEMNFYYNLAKKIKEMIYLKLNINTN